MRGQRSGPRQTLREKIRREKHCSKGGGQDERSFTPRNLYLLRDAVTTVRTFTVPSELLQPLLMYREEKKAGSIVAMKESERLANFE